MTQPNYRPFWGMLAFTGLFLLVIVAAVILVNGIRQYRKLPAPPKS